MAIIATSFQPALLVKYLQTYHSDLERWLSEWTIAINVSKSSVMLFAKIGRRIQNSEQYSSSGGQSNGSTSPLILVTLDKQLKWSKHIDLVREKATEIWNAWTSPEQEKRSFHQEWCFTV
jgi:hypothetical protein